MPIIPTIKIVTAEFMAPYYMGRRIKLEIIRLENGSFAVDRFLSGSINPWNQIAHENGFSTLSEAMAGASRTIITFSSGAIEISSPSLAFKVENSGGSWKIIDHYCEEDILPLRPLIFSEAIKMALEIAGGMII